MADGSAILEAPARAALARSLRLCIGTMHWDLRKSPNGDWLNFFSEEKTKGLPLCDVAAMVAGIHELVSTSYGGMDDCQSIVFREKVDASKEGDFFTARFEIRYLGTVGKRPVTMLRSFTVKQARAV